MAPPIPIRVHDKQQARVSVPDYPMKAIYVYLLSSALNVSSVKTGNGGDKAQPQPVARVWRLRSSR